MSTTRYHHPFSRAATVVWMLEEAGVPYKIRFVDIMKREHKAPERVAPNPMGRLPTLVAGETVVTGFAAIGLSLADRYAHGPLAPTLHDPARATCFRWSLFAPSVVEPGAMAKLQNWAFNPSNAGWGAHDDMLATMERAIRAGPYLLGERFTMADVIFGATLRDMLAFKTVEPRASFTDYVARVSARPASQRADARNNAVLAERGLNAG